LKLPIKLKPVVSKLSSGFFIDSIVLFLQFKIQIKIAMKRVFLSLLGFLFFFNSLPADAQSKDAENKLPKDPQVIVGKLENGLTYYIRQNHKPENRIEFRMVLNAGSILEDDDQQGLAHFIEHMAFNGTEDFDKADLVNFLEKSGLDFGADLNAYTSFDETVYQFQMPSDRPGLVDSAFLVLENWAHKLSLDPVEIDKERGVVREEWRLGLGAQDRMMKKYIPIILKDSRYAERLPIGKMSVIDSCSYVAVERFYNDWYRPDLMAIIVVGDIDPAFAEEKIKSTFGRIKDPVNERERIVYDIPKNDLPLVAIATDKEATSTIAMLIRKLDKFNVKTEDDYRTKLKLDLYIGMLNARFFEEVQDPDAPFLYASSDYSGFLAKSLDAFTMFSVVKENRIDDAIGNMIQQNKRVKRYGFSKEELERQKARMLSNFEKALEEKDKTQSGKYVNEYVSNFLNHEPFPGIEYETDLVKKYLPGITLDEVNQMSYFIGKKDNLIALITAPEEKDVTVPSVEDVLATIESASKKQPEPYKEEALQTSLIQKPLPGGSIVEISKNDEFGTTELLLNNGVRVVLKPTDFKNDEILMTSFGFGGTSLASDEEYISASFANQIMSMSGIGNFNTVELSKFLTGKNVSVNPEIDDLSQGISGRSVKKDLETMFELTYLYFTEPRKDTTAFKTFRAQMTAQFKFMMSNPQAVFYDTIFKLATQNDPRTIVIPTQAQINSIKLDEAYSFYKNRFDNANGFTFVFVGNFKVDSISPLISKYLGSLPFDENTETWRDVDPEFPSGITEAHIHKGTEPKSSVVLMMDEKFDWNVESRLEMGILMKILNIRMRESMREDQGGVYGVQAQPTMQKYPKEEVNILIGWGCAPENVDNLVKTVFAEMDTLQMNGPETVNLEKAKEAMLRDFETNSEENMYWLGKLKNAKYYNEELLSLNRINEIINGISASRIQQLAKKYFNDDHYLKVILMPEEVSNE